MATLTPVKVRIEPHNGVNKRFDVDIPYARLMVDYDDVDHAAVDAAVEVLKVIVEKHWDETLFNKKRKELVLKEWEDNEYDIQQDYFTEGGFEGFLKDRGLIS